MKKYVIVISEKAYIDAANLAHYIKHELKSPMIAENYMRDLNNTIQSLSSYADSISISQSNYIQSLCGPNARRINFKKQAIIYTIEGDYVYIRRIIAGALIH
ncbi:hypothetical protein Barb6XT_01542 [Bacteroidales bacterium Barb6XT]|nr:hypothetical protein Barb6XT_01542 [Bacteroidales bacterium Barb6XT]